VEKPAPPQPHGLVDRWCRNHHFQRPGNRPRTETAASRRPCLECRSEATQATQIERIGLWHAASPTDGYLKRAEQAGDTPFAYTLSSGHHPSAIVLAPRFFTETTPTARAALMIHEMGHYRAYVQTGHSDEYDGYKAEYDTHTKLGLGESDGLTYFSMLDGVVENVAPRLPVYKTYPDVQGYIQQSTNG
jgi:hypothetical protein